MSEKLLNQVLPAQIIDQSAERKSLDDPSLFINREVSWLRFNYRVLEEAHDTGHPLLERVKFLAISGSNLDEFFMTRASVLEQHIERGEFEPTPGSRMTPLEQMKVTRSEILPLLRKQKKCWEELSAALTKENILIQKPNDLTSKKKRMLREYFQNEILPVMKKPNADYVAPYITNLHVDLLVVGDDPRMEESSTKLMVEMPTDTFGRFIRVPDSGDSRDIVQDNFVLLEDLVAANLDLLFPSLRVRGCYKFRVTRNAEIDVKADENTDFLTTMELSVRQRRYGKPARLEFEASMPPHLREYLTSSVGSFRVPRLEDVQYEVDGHFGLVDFWRLLKLDKPNLKDVPFKGYVLPELESGKSIFAALAAKDFVLYHPYDSFDMVVNLMAEAATDPDVTEIYITLYRIDPDSPIILSLMKAAANGKSVTALIELKAKFDETNNIKWARVMTEAGVKVVYNFPKIKVHAKLALIVRKEEGKLVQYAHLGSGNYNTVTTRIYGDLGYLTAKPEICAEVLDLFHRLITDPREAGHYKYLLVAPASLKSEILSRIERETASHKENGHGYLAFKMNGLVDKNIIQALYRASQAGVRIDLNVRGLCCLRPGISGYSENIRVISIVGRFLEHARIYYFRNGGDEEVLLGSSDMMPRNLEKRVELLFSVPDPAIKSSMLKILDIHLRDNVKARRLLADGTYERVRPLPGEEINDSQRWLIENKGAWHERVKPQPSGNL
ncbi:MAG TPA: polyphosphate kinase 1 [Candidatus Saccharimonadales bacterium]|nr:polyphosphate kinase 1 [Candidatus Saccharimonadales bacterium]